MILSASFTCRKIRKSDAGTCTPGLKKEMFGMAFTREQIEEELFIF